MAAVTYGTGVLIAADRGDRLLWSRHRGLLLHGVVPTAPAPVLAQAWRGGAQQARLARLLAGCHVEALSEEQAKAVGVLLGQAGASDIVDATAVECATRRGDVIVTSDCADVEALVAATGRPVGVQDV